MKKRIIIFIMAMLHAGITMNAQVPTEFSSMNSVASFLSQQPQFESTSSGTTVTLAYFDSYGYYIFVDGYKIGKLDLPPAEHRITKNKQVNFGVPWMYGYAPMSVALNSGKATILMWPIQGEENMSSNSRGQLQIGRTGRTDWMSLSLNSDGVVFMPCDDEPEPERYVFTGFATEKLSL